MTYVDGFVADVPTVNREIYKKHVEAAVTSEVAAGLVLANLEHRSVIGAELSVIGASTLGTKSFVQSHPR
jgi:hypothetical protein